MNKLTVALFTLLLLATASLLGCSSSMSNPRLLQSIAVTPETAGAPNPGGQVQFSATGQYSMAPSPSKVMNAGWCMSDSNGCIGTTNATVDTSGLAQCDPSFSGTVTVRAMSSSGAGAPVMMPSDAGVLISGTAQLTCP